jgi:preprotein translocase subunit SecG
MIILIISLLGKYFWEATVRYPEIRAIFNAGKKYEPLAKILVIIGIIMMITSYLIELLQEKLREDKELKDKTGKNPYDEEY